MILPKNNRGFSLIPVLVFIAIFSVLGFGISYFMRGSSEDVLSAIAQRPLNNARPVDNRTPSPGIIVCIQNPDSPDCKGKILDKPDVNRTFFQGAFDTQPPRTTGGGSNRGDDICDTQPDSQACAEWKKFKDYCDRFGVQNADANCKEYLGSKGVTYQDANTQFVNFCKSANGKFDQRCLDNGIYCQANPNDAVCRKSTPTPAGRPSVTPAGRPSVTPTPVVSIVVSILPNGKCPANYVAYPQPGTNTPVCRLTSSFNIPTPAPTTVPTLANRGCPANYELKFQPGSNTGYCSLIGSQQVSCYLRVKPGNVACSLFNWRNNVDRVCVSNGRTVSVTAVDSCKLSEYEYNSRRTN